MDIVHIDKCRYEIQKQKEVPVWYSGITGPFRALTIPDHCSRTLPCDDKVKYRAICSCEYFAFVRCDLLLNSSECRPLDSNICHQNSLSSFGHEICGLTDRHYLPTAKFTNKIYPELQISCLATDWTTG
jgi:hypothetical protein